MLQDTCLLTFDRAQQVQLGIGLLGRQGPAGLCLQSQHRQCPQQLLLSAQNTMPSEHQCYMGGLEGSSACRFGLTKQSACRT